MTNMLNIQNGKDFFKLLDEIPVASFLFDEDFQILYANKEALKLFNVNSSYAELDLELLYSNNLIRQIKEKIIKIKNENVINFELTESSSRKNLKIIVNKIPINKSLIILYQVSPTTEKTIEEYFSSFINVTHDLLLIIDSKEYKILAANNNALKTYNTSKENIIDSNFIYLSRIPEIEIEHLQNLNLTNQPYEYETVHFNNNGDDIFLKAKVSKTFYNNNEVILFSASEITSDKITENKLVSVENRFQVLFENSPLMTFIIDSDGNILSTNSAVQMELKYLPKEIIGKHISKIYHPDDEQLINYQINQCLQYQNKAFTWELRLLNRFNNTIWVRVSAVSFASDKAATEIMIVCDNITVQKDTEKTLIDYAKSLQRMLDASPLGVLVYSLDEENNLRLITTNHSAEEILKINLENFSYKNIEEIFPSLPYQIVKKFKDIANKGGNLLFQKLRYYDKNISGIYEYSAIQLAEKTVAVFFTDITEREKALEQIAESKVDKGSTFTISFPISDTEILQSKSVVKSNSEISSEDSIKFEVKPNILLVENDDASIEVTRLFLKDVCELDVVANGEQAVESVKAKNYDVILMDINPGRGLSGLDVTQKIRSQSGYENVPIVAVTAFAMIGDKEEFIKAGCTHYLSKPFKKNELLELISEIISSR